jgi:hypothetical protein
MEELSATQQIDNIITQYGGWKAENIRRIRAIIGAVSPDIVEEVKWKMRSRPEGLPVWSHNGIICILETFKDNQKLVFFKGAQMSGLSQHFNARLNSSTDRAIELHDGDGVDANVITQLVQEAIRLNNLKRT